MLGGHSLADPRPGHARAPERILVGTSEWTTDKDIQKYVKAAKSASGGSA